MDDSLFPFDEFCADVIEFVTEGCSWTHDEAVSYAETLHDYWQNGWSAREAILHDFANLTIDEREESDASERNYID